MRKNQSPQQASCSTPLKIPIKRQLRQRIRERRGHLGTTRARDRVTEVHGGADALIDFEVAWDEDEGRHPRLGLPGRLVGLGGVVGVLALFAEEPGEDLFLEGGEVEGFVGGGF